MRNVPAMLTLLTTLAAAAAGAAPAWNLVLGAEATVSGETVTLADVAVAPVPADLADLVVLASGRPGHTATVTRRGILRKLVSHGRAAGVRLSGAEACRVTFAGQRISSEQLHESVRRALQPLVPTPAPGAPATWFELDLPDRPLAAGEDWDVNVDRHEPLAPGRNFVRVELVRAGRSEAVSATVILHSFQEVATTRRDIGRDDVLLADMFAWQWRDQAEVDQGVALGRQAVIGRSASRDVGSGKLLRTADLKDTPLVTAGEPVELQVIRGNVAVTVRAFARQAGCLGQIIPVRNELTGRLVNAKIAGPGLVEWRR